MAWPGFVAMAGLTACALWALCDLVSTRMLRQSPSDPTLRRSRRRIIAGRLLVGVIVAVALAVVGLTVLILVIELRA